MATDPSLTAVIALARAGALTRAWSLLRELQRETGAGDPRTLNVQARLLKDEGGRSGGADRSRLYREAATVYRTSAGIQRSTYALINSATLSLLSDDQRSAKIEAERVLIELAHAPEEPETPYYRAATRAEALLLLDRQDEAQAAFAEAIAVAPRAWEDHASTLRQFGLILAAQGRDAAWLDANRPPRSLHFGGHMSFDPKVVRREHLDERIAALLEEENIGFGYGALAAGADIIVAEALLERGAELHAVLPGGAEAFAAVSVDPFGKAWRRRFDALIAQAATVRAVRPLATPPDRMMIAVADEVAMGAAAMNARRLETSALQLLVVPDEETGEGGAANANARWTEAGWRQRIIAAPREPLDTRKPPRLPAAPHTRLAIVTVGAGGADGIAARLVALARRLQEGAAPRLGPYFTGRESVFAFSDPAEAARAALSLAAAADEAGGGGIGGHYGIADPIDDPFSGEARLAGEPTALAVSAGASAPPGAVCVTADFAAALAAAREERIYSELVGELDPPDGGEPIELYALKPRL